MAINGVIGSFSRNDERARGGGHPPVILSGAVKASDGDYPVGLILTRNSDGVLVPYEAVVAEAVGTGGGTDKTFTKTLANVPILPGSVAVTDETEAFTDDGYGRLTGDAAGTGTINYTSGALSVSFHAAPTLAQEITADYERDVVGVLDQDVDTTKSGAALYIVHGSVQELVLKVGKTDQDAPSAALLQTLRDKGIYSE